MELERDTILSQLKSASEAYYNNDEQIMTDEDYDELSSYAESQGWLKQDSKVNDGAKLDLNNVIVHSIPMLSLAKAKNKQDLLLFLERIDKSTDKLNTYKIEPKLDGLAISLKYDNGVLVGVYTRGTGTQGENASHLIDNPDLSITTFCKNVPENISEVRGELVCSKADLLYNNEQRGEDFKNERIAAAGLLKKSELGLGYKAKLDFVAYSAYDVNGAECQVPDVGFIKSIDDFGMQTFTLNDNIDDILEEANNKRKTYKYPTDGVVIKMTTPVYLGATSHHPLNAVAYKYPGECKTTKLKYVIWGTGKTGRFTPIGELEPVVLGGVTITNVSLNNMDWIRERGIKINSLVEITRSNDVIPYIKRVVYNGDDTVAIYPPEFCPYCGSELEYDSAYLVCPNHNCESTVKNRIKAYVAKTCLDIEGMNEALINVMSLQGVKDLLDVKLDDLVAISYSNGTKLGETRAKIIYDNIQRAKQNTPDYIWLTTLEIPNLGQSTAKALIKEFYDIDNVLSADLDALKQVDGIGELTALNIYKYRDNALSIWESIKPMITLPEKVQKNGITFCITGKVPDGYSNRQEYVKAMEDKGFTFHSTIKKDTLFLVCDDVNGNSSKLQKARKLGIVLVNNLDDVVQRRM